MNVKIQFGRGQAHAGSISAMPNEVLLVHEPDPNANKIIKNKPTSGLRVFEIAEQGLSSPTGNHEGLEKVAIGSVSQAGVILLQRHPELAAINSNK